MMSCMNFGNLVSFWTAINSQLFLSMTNICFFESETTCRGTVNIMKHKLSKFMGKDNMLSYTQFLSGSMLFWTQLEFCRKLYHNQDYNHNFLCKLHRKNGLWHDRHDLPKETAQNLLQFVHWLIHARRLRTQIAIEHKKMLKVNSKFSSKITNLRKGHRRFYIHITENNNNLKFSLISMTGQGNWLHVNGFVLWRKSRSWHLATFTQKMIHHLVKVKPLGYSAILLKSNKTLISPNYRRKLHRRQKCQIKWIYMSATTYLKTFKTDPSKVVLSKSITQHIFSLYTYKRITRNQGKLGLLYINRELRYSASMVFHTTSVIWYKILDRRDCIRLNRNQLHRFYRQWENQIIALFRLGKATK